MVQSGAFGGEVDFVYPDPTAGTPPTIAFGNTGNSDISLLAPNGDVVDEVDMRDFGSWFFNGTQGRTLQLDVAHANATDNDSGAHWCWSPVDGSSYTRGELVEYGNPVDIAACPPKVEILSLIHI